MGINSYRWKVYKEKVQLAKLSDESDYQNTRRANN